MTQLVYFTFNTSAKCLVERRSLHRLQRSHYVNDVEVSHKSDSASACCSTEGHNHSAAMAILASCRRGSTTVLHGLAVRRSAVSAEVAMVNASEVCISQYSPYPGGTSLHALRE